MIKNLILGLSFALLTLGCEEPPEVKSVRPTTPAIPLAQASPTPEGIEKKKPLVDASGRISFNEDAASAMAKVKELIAKKNGGTVSANNPLPYQTPSPGTVPPEIKEALEDAKNDKAINDSLNAVLADLPQSPEPELQKTEPADDLAGAPAMDQTQPFINPGNREGTIGAGVRVPSKAAAPSSSNGSGNSQSKPTPSPTPAELKFIKDAMPRGHMMLFMPHPKARAASDALVQNLVDANIENVFIGVLTDGTFGTDFDYVKSVLSKLSAAGRVITLATYVVNGATMKYFDKTPITAGFAKTDPRKFRKLIVSNPETRARYLNFAKAAGLLLRYNHELNSKNKNIAIPMLEDNLNRESYMAIRALMKEALTGIPHTVVRNPCLGCYSGNDAYTPGDPREEHGEVEFYRVQKGDAFSFDGAQFHYPNETASGTTYSQAKVLMAEAERRELLFFGLWRAYWQGLNKGSGIHPDNREYLPPTSQELTWNIELLRAGLD